MGWLGKDRCINGLAGERFARIEWEGRAGISVSGEKMNYYPFPLFCVWVKPLLLVLCACVSVSGPSNILACLSMSFTFEQVEVLSGLWKRRICAGGTNVA